MQRIYIALSALISLSNINNQQHQNNSANIHRNFCHFFFYVPVCVFIIFSVISYTVQLLHFLPSLALNSLLYEVLVTARVNPVCQ